MTKLKNLTQDCKYLQMTGEVNPRLCRAKKSRGMLDKVVESFTSLQIVAKGCAELRKIV
jgi:hypothetical protein